MEIHDEISLEGLLDNDESKSKWTAKDSVFTKLFGAEDKKYLYQLYRALHPEDEATAKEDLTVMTLESHLLEQQHNDLGFLVHLFMNIQSFNPALSKINQSHTI